MRIEIPSIEKFGLVAVVGAAMWLGAACSGNGDSESDGHTANGDTAAPTVDSNQPVPDTADTTGPDSNANDTTTPDTAAPDSATVGPDTNENDTAVPDTAAPDTNTASPDTAEHDTATPDTDTCPPFGLYYAACTDTSNHSPETCLALGYTFTIEKGIGYCTLPDGTKCSIAAFNDGSCAPEQNLCAKLGLLTDSSQLGGVHSALCVDTDGCPVDYMEYIGCWLVQNPDAEFHWP